MKFHVLLQKMKRLSNIKKIKRVKILWNYKQIKKRKKLLNIEETFLLRNTKELLKSNTIYPSFLFMLYSQILRSIFLIIDESFKIIINQAQGNTIYSFQRNIFEQKSDKYTVYVVVYVIAPNCV